MAATAGIGATDGTAHGIAATMAGATHTIATAGAILVFTRMADVAVLATTASVAPLRVEVAMVA